MHVVIAIALFSLAVWLWISKPTRFVQEDISRETAQERFGRISMQLKEKSLVYQRQVKQKEDQIYAEIVASIERKKRDMEDGLLVPVISRKESHND